MFDTQQEVKDAELLSFELRWHRGVAARQAGYRLAALFHECPQVSPLSWSSAKGIPNPRAPITWIRGGLGALAFVELATRRPGSYGTRPVDRFPTEWRPTEFRGGPKPSRQKWLHLLRKARLANLMSQAHEGECDAARTFTSLENSVRVGGRGPELLPGIGLIRSCD